MKARLLLSARTLEDVIYRTELEGPDVVHTLTRERPPGWSGYARRVDLDLLREVAWPALENPLAYVCGPTAWFDQVERSLLLAGLPPEQLHHEAFEW